MSTIGVPLKYFGGKSYLASRIVEMFPPHLHYVEPYFGGGAVLFARDPSDERLWLPPNKGVSEVANDIDRRLTNFWHVLRHEEAFEEFRRTVEATPMGRIEWDEAETPYLPESAKPFSLYDGGRKIRVETLSVADAVAFFVRCRQSRAGMLKDFTSITRTRTRRQMNGNVSEWLGAVDGLPDVHARLRRVLIENLDGVKLIRREDTKDTLFYVDAPYVHGTRTGKNNYAHEMTDGQHEELIQTLIEIRGMAIVSMYRHPIYDVLSLNHGWNVKEIELPNNAAGGKSKRRMTECLWWNF
jgi:DNA adenine methylase